jgi:tight adherence protein C
MAINPEFLLPLLTFLSVFAIGSAILAARVRSKDPVKARLRELEQTGGETDKKDQGLMPRLARLSKMFSRSNPSQKLQAKLAKAGYHDKSAASVFLGVKMVLLIFGSVATALATLSIEMSLALRPLVVFAGGALLSFIPNIVVRVRREKRRNDVRSNLPDAVDLLEICVSAGMGLDMAWNAVADEIRRVSTILADEMALTNLEMHLGVSRTLAMRHMVERTGADELSSLIAVLVQSERFGTSITEALRTFATSTREVRSQRAEESAEKMPVKLLFPMVFFIFPVVLVVVAGPAGMTLMEIMGGK